MSLQPHGGLLVQAFYPEKEITTIHKEIELDAISLSDLELIAVGAIAQSKAF